MDVKKQAPVSFAPSGALRRDRRGSIIGSDLTKEDNALRLSRFRQTVFIDHEDRNYAWLDVEGWDQCNPFGVTVEIGGKTAAEVSSMFRSRVELYLPRVTEPTECVICLRPFEDTPVYERAMLRPVPDATVDIITSSHSDLGYCGYLDKLEAQYSDFLDMAMDLCDRDEGFHYVIEHEWWLRCYERRHDEAGIRRLEAYLRSGRIELNAPHSANHTHWQGYEQLLRAVSFSCIHAADRYGFRPRTALYADMSGMTWAAVSAYAHMGIRYAAVYPNESFRLSRDGTPLPRVFWWLAPNGRDRLLCHYQPAYYELSVHEVFRDCSRHGPLPLDGTRLEKLTYAVDAIAEEMGDPCWDTLPLGIYDDVEPPTDRLPALCRAMGEKWASPRFCMSTLEKALSHMEEAYGDEIPVISGELGEQWSDFASIAPAWFARKRRADRYFAPAETVCALRSAVSAAPYPAELLREIQWRMGEFDDHCWATSSKHPQEMHIYNLRLTKEQSAAFADESVSGLLSGRLGTPGDRASLQNLLPFPAGGFTDTPFGDEVQRFSDGTVLSRVGELAPFGRRVCAAPLPAESRALPQDAASFSTEYYRVTLDPGSRHILQIRDLRLDRDLLDPHARFPFGEYIYVTTEGKLDDRLFFEVPGAARVTLEDGPVALRLIRTCYEEQSGASVRTEIRFFHSDPTIEVRLSFRRAAGLIGDYYDRYKKNVFFSFPLGVPDHRFYTELAGCVAGDREILPFNPKDFVTAQSWVAAENRDFGVAVHSRDLPLFHLGEIRYNRLSSRTDLHESSGVFLYAASNRCNQLNFPDPDSCRGDYCVSILPYAAGERGALHRWSQIRSLPPFPASPDVPALPVLAVEDPAVRLLAFKKAELSSDVFVLRLLEQGGEARTAEVILPAGLRAAEYADGTERPLGRAAAFSGDRLSVELQPLSYATVLLRFENSAPVPEEPWEPGDIRNVFAFSIQNDRTLVSFETAPECRAEAFEILRDGRTAAVVPRTGPRLQRAYLDEPCRGEYAVRAADSDQEV